MEVDISFEIRCLSPCPLNEGMFRREGARKTWAGDSLSTFSSSSLSSRLRFDGLWTSLDGVVFVVAGEWPFIESSRYEEKQSGHSKFSGVNSTGKAFSKLQVRLTDVQIWIDTVFFPHFCF